MARWVVIALCTWSKVFKSFLITPDKGLFHFTLFTI